MEKDNLTLMEKVNNYKKETNYINFSEEELKETAQDLILRLQEINNNNKSEFNRYLNEFFAEKFGKIC